MTAGPGASTDRTAACTSLVAHARRVPSPQLVVERHVVGDRIAEASKDLWLRGVEGETLTFARD